MPCLRQAGLSHLVEKTLPKLPTNIRTLSFRMLSIVEASKGDDDSEYYTELKNPLRYDMIDTIGVKSTLN